MTDYPMPDPLSAPVQLEPGTPIGGMQLFTPAVGPRNVLLDAFYEDERGGQVRKEDHPIKSFFNRYTRFPAAQAVDINYSTALVGTWMNGYPNPLNDVSISVVLPQTVEGFRATGRGDEATFTAPGRYGIYAPDELIGQCKRRQNPTALVTIFFGVNTEINLFGLRTFFDSSADRVLVTVPGVEQGWAGVSMPWGIGIDETMLDDLFIDAGLVDASGHPAQREIRVLAGYSTGYRGLNLTIINRLVPLDKVGTLIIFDAFYIHNDWPVSSSGSPYAGQNTKWAIETLLATSANANVVVYGITDAGTPRDASRLPIGPLSFVPSANLVWLDLQYGTNYPKGQGNSPIADQLLKICLARLVQGGTGDYFQESDVPVDVLNVMFALPRRGDFSTGSPGAPIDLRQWLNQKVNADAIRTFTIGHAMALVTKYKLQAGWTVGDAYEMLHRIFVPELGAEWLTVG